MALVSLRCAKSTNNIGCTLKERFTFFIRAEANITSVIDFAEYCKQCLVKHNEGGVPKNACLPLKKNIILSSKFWVIISNV